MMNASMDSNFGINTTGMQDSDGSGITVSDGNIGIGSGMGEAMYRTFPENMTGWGYWQDYYYPHVIRESYPVYLQDRSEDKGKQAFEIIKVLKDKKLVKLNKVGDVIDLMDELIKIL